MVVPYFQRSGEGKFCFPINITASGVSGIQDRANETIQVIFDRGDGILYQVSFAFYDMISGLMELLVCRLDAVCECDSSK
jgi:hypothetical protein